VEVLVPPPPSAGGSLVGFALQLTERLGLSPDRFLAPEHLLAVADVLGMVSELRQAGYDAQISDPQAAREWLSTAQVDQWALRLAAARESRHFGSTTHISVADGQDGAASLTTSNGEGCGYTITDLGIHVNNFMGEEDINPAGFHVHPSGQPLSTMMSPAIALQDGRPTLVLGSGGSNRIRSVVYQGLLNRLYFGRTLDEALRAPRVHVEGARLWFESTGLSERSTEALLASWEGATRFPEPNMFFGGVHAVAREGDRWIGAGDRRRGGVALVQDA